MTATASAMDVPPPARTALGRDVSSDYLKAISIVAVVAIHCGFPIEGPLRFAVPVFVGLWAYYLELRLQKTPAEQHVRLIAARCGQVFVIYAFWTALYLAIKFHALHYETTPWHSIIGGWLGGAGWAGQYFLILLLQLFVVFNVIRRLISRRTIWPLVMTAIAFDCFVEYYLYRYRLAEQIGDRFFIYWLPYVMLGIAFARGYPARHVSLIVPAMLLLLGSTFELEWLARHVGRTSVYLAAGVTVGSACLLLATAPRQNAMGADPTPALPASIQRILLYLGRNTLGIYVGHVLLRDAVGEWGTQNASAFQLWLRMALLATCSIASGLLITRGLIMMGLGIVVGAPASEKKSPASIG